jgi:hypothetical protein
MPFWRRWTHNKPVVHAPVLLFFAVKIDAANRHGLLLFPSLYFKIIALSYPQHISCKQ